MPTDLLFDYDDFRLRTSAVDSIAKLGQIIQRNPGATFIIEGHSDGIGSADYNLRLSQLRAESVKVWLVQAMRIDPRQIQTRGLGMSRLIVPGNLGVDEQQINRRVEIVIRNASGR
jgi:outer membrane protein OmpA-like peptidoglycan-associated protein